TLPSYVPKQFVASAFLSADDHHGLPEPLHTPHSPKLYKLKPIVQKHFRYGKARPKLYTPSNPKALMMTVPLSKTCDKEVFHIAVVRSRYDQASVIPQRSPSANQE